MNAYQIISRDRHSMIVRFNSSIVEQLWHPDWNEEIWTEEQAKNHEKNGTSYSCCMEVCGRCNGTSKIVHPSVDSHGISEQEFAEDPDFAEDYWSGAYDILCPECKGQNVVPVLQLPENIEKIVNGWYEDQASYDRECAAERAMGC